MCVCSCLRHGVASFLLLFLCFWVSPPPSASAVCQSGHGCSLLVPFTLAILLFPLSPVFSYLTVAKTSPTKHRIPFLPPSGLCSQNVRCILESLLSCLLNARTKLQVSHFLSFACLLAFVFILAPSGSVGVL